MYGEGFCMHCHHVTTFERVKTNIYYPRYLHSDGYCAECHKFGSNVEIRNLRNNKERNQNYEKN